MTTPAPGRSCADCTMCCKVLPIEALNKPANQWCQHCQVGQGCKIYAERPDECRGFNCMWLVDAKIPVELAPRDSRMVLAETRGAIFIVVDQSRFGAWRKCDLNGVLRPVTTMATRLSKTTPRHSSCFPPHLRV